MSLGSRIAKRARATITASLASTPREPLLFLYPQWPRNSSSASAKPIREQQNGRQDNTAPATPVDVSPSFPGSVDPLKQHFKAAKEDNEVSNEDVRGFERKEELDIALSNHDNFNEICLPISSFHSKSTSAGAPFAEARRTSTPVFYDSGSRRERLRRKTQQLSKTSSQAELSAKTKSELKMYNEHLHLMDKELDEQWVIDWRSILSDLKKHTPRQGPWLEKAIRVVVPEESMARLVHAIDGHIWDTGLNYGCSVNLQAGDEGKLCQAFIISGTLVSLGKFTADLLLAAPDIQISSGGQQPQPPYSTSEEAVQFNRRGIRYPKNEEPRKSKRPRVNETLRPEVWTPESFLEYIRAITDPTASSHIKHLRQEDEGYRLTTVNILNELFEDPRCSSSITRTACHEAMTYLIRVNRIEDLRILFVRLSQAKMDMNTETFNIMLRGAAGKQNLTSFHFVLHLMLKRGITPNARTWLAFMEALSDLTIRGHVFNSMKEKGLLGNKAVVKGVSYSLLQHAIESSLNNNESQETFVANMDAQFTPHWLSVWAGSRILHTLAGRGLISRCWEFLHFMQSRSVEPNTQCINAVLRHCREQRNLSGAIQLLRSLPPTSTYVPNEETYGRLFSTAWQSQSYNLVRVIWRYACLSGATSFEMRRRIHDSIKAAAAKCEPVSGRARFRQQIGPVVFGNSYRGAHPTQVSNQMATRRGVLRRDGSSERAGPVSKLTKTPGGNTLGLKKAESDLMNEGKGGQESLDLSVRRPSSTPRLLDVSLGYQGPVFPMENVFHSKDLDLLSDEQHDLIFSLINLDYSVYPEWKPEKPLALALVEAEEKDKQWRHIAWDNKQNGTVEMTVERMLAERQRMINDAVSIEIRSTNGLKSREWK